MMLRCGPIQCATDLLLFRDGSFSPLNSSDSSSHISLPFSDECLRKASARDRTVAIQEPTATSPEFKTFMAESTDLGSKIRRSCNKEVFSLERQPPVVAGLRSHLLGSNQQVMRRTY
jgi:hypothetical protein